MSNIYLEEIQGRTGLLTNERYGEYIFTMQAQELSASYITFFVTSLTAPPVITIQGSYDDGATFEDIDGISVPTVAAPGRYFLDITSTIYPCPIYRLIIRPPVGETCTIDYVRKLRCTELAQVRVSTSILNSWCDTVDVLSGQPVNYVAPVTKSDATVGVMLGWNGSQHREVTLDTQNRLLTSSVIRATDGTTYRDVLVDTQGRVIPVAWDGAGYRRLAVDTGNRLLTYSTVNAYNGATYAALRTDPNFSLYTAENARYTTNIYINYSTDPIDSSASLPFERKFVRYIEIFDSSGYTYTLVVLDSGADLMSIIVPPGGIRVPLNIYADGFRLITDTPLNSGELIISIVESIVV